MPQGTLTVTATETDVSVTGFQPGDRVSFEIQYHFGDTSADYLSIGGYTDADDTGGVSLTIPLGGDFVQQVSGQPFTFAVGPVFTGTGTILATH